MPDLASIDGANTGSSVPPPASVRLPADASAELAKLETKLADWVHCPSSRTPEGKAHIADITQQINAIKNQVKKAEAQRAPRRVSTPQLAPAGSAGAKVRLDGLGTYLDLAA